MIGVFLIGGGIAETVFPPLCAPVQIRADLEDSCGIRERKAARPDGARGRSPSDLARQVVPYAEGRHPLFTAAPGGHPDYGQIVPISSNS